MHCSVATINFYMDGIFLTEQVKILNSNEFFKLPFPSKEWDLISFLPDLFYYSLGMHD